MSDNNQDDINNPSHYTHGTIEAHIFIDGQHMDWYDSNLIKYICRCRYKGCEFKDRSKALWYLMMGMIKQGGWSKTLGAVEKTIGKFKKEYESIPL